MAVGLFGVPSVFSGLCVHLVKGLLAQAYGSCEPVKVASLAEFQSPVLETSLFHHDTPEPELIESLVSQNIPLIVFLSGLEANIHESMSFWGMPFHLALRQTTLSLSALEEAVAVPNAFIIRSHARKRIVIQLLMARICAFLGIEPHKINIEEIIRSLNLRPSGDGNTYLDEQLQSAKILAGCTLEEKAAPVYPQNFLAPLRGYNNILDLKPASAIRWPGEIFSTEANEPAGPGQKANLLGPARVHFFGPYAGLPKGRWTARITFSVSNNLSGNQIILDISQNYAQDILVKGESKLPASGAYTCDMPFYVTRPHLPIEIRLLTTQGAIEGEIEFLGVDLKRLSSSFEQTRG